MADVQHSEIQHADTHEPKWITTALVADTGKVITPSASEDATSELRFLTLADIAAGQASTARFGLADGSDSTKIVAFSLSGLTTATTRTITVPDADLTLVGTSTTQTLTNKRITPRVSDVAYAAALDVNADNFDVLACDSLTGNVAINAPTGTPTSGQRLAVRLTQDATGGRTITYDAAFVTATASTTTLSTTETREFMWHAARAKWIQVSVSTGI
jgi:hypothetical protein